MGVRALYDPKEDATVLYCSTSMRAFGPVLDGDVAEDLWEYLEEREMPDLRAMSPTLVEDVLAAFCRTMDERNEVEGEAGLPLGEIGPVAAYLRPLGGWGEV